MWRASLTPAREWPVEQKFMDGDSPFSSCHPTGVALQTGPPSPCLQCTELVCVCEGECFPVVGTVKCEALLYTLGKAACNRTVDSPPWIGAVTGAD